MGLGEELYNAAQNGKSADVASLIGRRADVNWHNPNGVRRCARVANACWERRRAARPRVGALGRGGVCEGGR